MNRLSTSLTNDPLNPASVHAETAPRRRVAVDATCWQNNRGYGRHARNLLGALARLDTRNRYWFFVDSEEMLEALPPNVESVLVKTTKPTAYAASSDGRRAFSDMLRMSRALSKPGFDLALFPTVYSYVPVFSRAHKMVFIHDVIAEKYPDLTLPSLSARLAWKLKMQAALRQAGTIVTVSEFSKIGIVDVFKVAAQTVKVIGEAPNPIFRKLKATRTQTPPPDWSPAEKRQIVYVGGFGPHKNLTCLLEAFACVASRDGFEDILLTLVGEYRSEVFHSEYSELRRKIDALGIESKILFTGYLPDEALVALLNRAQVLVLPSFMEGFGLPAVEAAACGCPVIATKSSPLPDLLGDGAIYFDPHSGSELEAALIQVLASESLRDRLSQAGMKAAEKLTWDDAALALMDLIESIPPL
ncbi:MAG: glycosyltransferase family 4 protein [Anaerolineales bacterium]|nr:glycosyltransferase family 4 protein [Anaerolineales bacterium]